MARNSRSNAVGDKGREAPAPAAVYFPDDASNAADASFFDAGEPEIVEPEPTPATKPRRAAKATVAETPAPRGPAGFRVHGTVLYKPAAGHDTVLAKDGDVLTDLTDEDVVSLTRSGAVSPLWEA